ncbi:hypothetical protein [Acidiphilium sp. MT5]
MNEAIPPKTDLVINLHEDKQNITILIRNENKITLDAKSLNELINLLSKIRCQMVPPARAADAAKPVQLLTDSTSRLMVDRAAHDANSIVIGVFHPGPGWIGVSLDKVAAAGFRDQIEFAARLVSTH